MKIFLKIINSTVTTLFLIFSQWIIMQKPDYPIGASTRISPLDAKKNWKVGTIRGTDSNSKSKNSKWRKKIRCLDLVEIREYLSLLIINSNLEFKNSKWLSKIQSIVISNLEFGNSRWWNNSKNDFIWKKFGTQTYLKLLIMHLISKFINSKWRTERKKWFHLNLNFNIIRGGLCDC